VPSEDFSFWCRQALCPYISDGRSRFWVNSRLVTQCFCREGWAMILESIKESRLSTQHHFILFFLLCFQQLNNASVMCHTLARCPLFSAKQTKLKRRKIDLPSPNKTNACLVPWQPTWRWCSLTVDFSLDVISLLSRQCYRIWNEIAFPIISPQFDLPDLS